MHECIECGMECDCDGEDMENQCPLPHECINPECEMSPQFRPEGEDESGAPEGASHDGETWTTKPDPESA